MQGYTHQALQFAIIIWVTLNGILIEVTDKEMSLGSIVYCHLDFHKQASVAIFKACQTPAMLKRSFANINKSTLPLLFNSMVRPLLDHYISAPLTCIFSKSLNMSTLPDQW